MKGKHYGLFLGLIMLVHSVYSLIEVRHLMEDSMHSIHIGMPKDILIEVVIGALIAVYSWAPNASQLQKIKAPEHFREKNPEQFEERPSFRNYYNSRASLIHNRASKGLEKPN
mmetsp:Transcript_19410/g.19399  ORF Transcript_19410/g.19399 Transcript_19410/m.19399 type:complete len:113 (+) Transcript_19410:11-349(+)